MKYNINQAQKGNEDEDIKTTFVTYGHLCDNTNFEVANKLSGIVNVKTATTQQTQFHGNQSFKYQEK